MVHWLVQDLQDYSRVARGLLSTSVFTEQETARLKGFRFAKRQQDYLLGRWTSKLLVQAIYKSQIGNIPALNEIEINNTISGAPDVSCELRYNQIPVSLSISHSGDRAFCAAVGISSPTCIPAGLIGADIELVEQRPAGFVEEYFTETEIALVSRSPVCSRDLLVTATWSAKESALKALHLGLSVDTRSVTCSIEAEADAPADWKPFRIDWDVHRLNRYYSGCAEPPEMAGWWRILDGYVLTLSTGEHTPPQEVILPSGEGA